MTSSPKPKSCIIESLTMRADFIFRFAVIFACIAPTYLLPVVSAQQPRVYRDRVQPNWFADDTLFWYRVDLPDAQKEFVLVDVKVGQRRPAFDHAKIAELLTKATSKTVESTKLPIDSIQLTDDLKTLELTGRGGVWRVDLATWTIETLKNGDVSRRPTGFFLPPRKSVGRGGDVQLEIRNEMDVDVELLWIDTQGQPQSYGKLTAGKQKSQHTYVGHVWLLNAGKTPLACFEAFDGRNEIVLNADSLKTVKRTDRPRKERREKERPPANGAARSRDDQWEAYVQDHNLWLKPIYDQAAESPRQLSTDATAEHSFHKDTSRARLVEMAYTLPEAPPETPDVRWAPNGKHLLSLQTTRVPEPRVQYIESSPKDSLQPVLQSYPYAKPGDPVPLATPRLFSTTDGIEVKLSTEQFSNPFKLQFLKWAEDSSRFWLFYNERAHQNLRVLEVVANSGEVRTVIDELSDTFIHYSTEGKFVLEWLGESELLWASERSGWNHLYRYDVATGNVINPVTSGEWNVRRIEDIDREAGVVWFYAVGVVAGQDPYHEHFCRVNIDGTGMQVLTAGDGTHEIEWSPDRSAFLDRYSRVDLAPVTEIRDASDGRLITDLEVGDASEIIRSRGHLPERFVAKGRDGKTDIYGIIHRPLNFDAGQSYPIVENIYAGPHDHHVPRAFRSSYRHQQQIADRGMIVVQIDGMGTAWRSKAFHDVCYRNLRDAGFPDRIAWIRAAAETRPFMDTNRVGIYGGSAGGQNAMAALLWHGTFYRAAVADCGCHDNRMDKLWWNEQWMGWPVDEFYVSNSNTENAHRLQGHLMLVVGELDRNVDPASTTQVVNALIKADKDFTFLPIPGAGHGACEGPYGSRRRAEFLAEHLRADNSQGF